MSYSLTIVQNENIQIDAPDLGVVTIEYETPSGSLPSGNLSLSTSGIVSGVTSEFKNSAGAVITGFPISSKGFQFYLHLTVPSNQASVTNDSYNVRAQNVTEGIDVNDTGTITVFAQSDSFIANLTDDHENFRLQAGGDTYTHNVTISRTQGVDGVVELVPHVPSAYSDKINFNIVGDSFVTFDSSSGNSIAKQVIWSATLDTETVNNDMIAGYDIYWTGGDHPDHDSSYDQKMLTINVDGATVEFSLPNGMEYTGTAGGVIDIPVVAQLTTPENVDGTLHIRVIPFDVPAYGDVDAIDVYASNDGGLGTLSLSIDVDAQALKNHKMKLVAQCQTNTDIQPTKYPFVTFTISGVHKRSTNPIIQENGILRLLPGNISKINGITAKGMWLGHIKREFAKGNHKPESGFYMYHTPVGKFGGTATVVTTNTGTAGFGSENRYYKIAQVYDGNQRSLLGHSVEAVYEGDADADPPVYKYGLFTIRLPLNTFNNRLTELEIYRASSQDGSYSRIINLPIADNVAVKRDFKTSTSITGTDYTGDVRNDKTIIVDEVTYGSFPDSTHNPDSSYNWGGVDLNEDLLRGSFWKLVKGSSTIVNFTDSGSQSDYYEIIALDGTTNGTGNVYNVLKTTMHGGSQHINTGTGTSWGSHYGGTLWGEEYTFKNFMWIWGIFNWGWGSGSIRTGPKIKAYRGKNVLKLKVDPSVSKDALAGKFLRDSNMNVYEILFNQGMYIQTKENLPTGLNQVFNLLQTNINIEYSKVTDNSEEFIQIKFNDPNTPEVGITPIQGEISTDVNGRFGIYLNGRLFQGDVILDPDDVAEVRPYWVTYSELDQPDINPVSNAIQFMDKEGGAITGLAKLFDNLVVLKEQSLFMLNCPPNVDPSAWTMKESMHNIGNIAPNGYVSYGGSLYTIFQDGIYMLSANNLAETDSTPTESLKITNPIQDVYDNVYDKTDIISIYDQYHDEVLFRWHDNPPNLLRNGDFEAGSQYWSLDQDLGGNVTNIDPYEGNFSCEILSEGVLNGAGALFSDYIPIDKTKDYTLSVWAKCPIMTNEKFYANWLFYNDSKGHVGGYPGMVSFSSNNDTWQQYSITIGPNGDVNIPSDARYMRARSYWWNASDMNPIGTGYVDRWALKEGLDNVSWETYESSQQIWGFNLVTNQWREIKTSGSIGKFALDKEGAVIFWDDRDHKIKSFNKKESVSASLLTNPVMMTSDRAEVVREIISKVQTPDSITLDVIIDGNTSDKFTTSLSAQTRPTREKKRFKKRGHDVQLQLTAPASTNDVEIHNLELEYS